MYTFIEVVDDPQPIFNGVLFLWFCYNPSFDVVDDSHCAVYASLNRHKFILFGTNLCHFGVNQYQVGMKSYHRTMESGVQKFSKKFSEELDDQM